MADGKGRSRAAVQAVNCPNCGATTAVRTFGHAVNVVCQSCHSILDAKDPGVTILQKFKDAVRVEPLIPLGNRGTIPGSQYPFEVVGFQVRQIVVDGQAYRWREYLLFNPYYGFRYLTEYGGHWNVATTLRSLPDGEPMPGTSGTRTYHGRHYRHFQTATATTVFVLGEFPWQVRVGEQAVVVDYVAPPQLLSAEVSAGKEVTWSLSQYAKGAEIWTGLSAPGKPPAAEGVFANQPSPYHGVVAKMWRQAVLLMALATIVWIAHLATARQQRAFSQTLVYDPRSSQDSSLVTRVFELDGRASAVKVETTSSLANQWVELGYALINDETGQAFEFTEEVSHYSGVDEGEAWSEGSPIASVTIPSIPAGRYFLRIESEGERTGKPVRYTVTVVRDVATSAWFVGALILVALPPLMTSFRAAGFERRRWQESDHAAGQSSAADQAEKDDDDE
jgi:ribosomal protein S27E